MKRSLHMVRYEQCKLLASTLVYSKCPVDDDYVQSANVRSDRGDDPTDPSLSIITGDKEELSTFTVKASGSGDASISAIASERL
ncbi:hypothetical protein M0R45_025152 [Rubus argutus]|uniref:Uncharacterized protein n=1 Tax=Rubus argutus TaxID=59490 RepID=A0AAW1WV86_RUBAR